MGWVFLLLIVAVVVAVIIAMKAKRQSGKSDEVWPFRIQGTQYLIIDSVLENG
ncbi:MAG: hypothetical protein NUV86_04420 [Candidatus Scalindua sp.]|nr:hypothetical protein [Candidatus Scalindua sp.]